MRPTLSALLCTALLLALTHTACDSESAEDRVAVVTTYNAGLATGYVDYADQRRPKLVELVKALDADLVCMQEVWTQQDLDAFTVGAAERFPHSHYVLLRDTTIGPPACDVAPAIALRECVDEACAGVGSGEIGGCVLGECNAEFFATGADCQSCLAANLGQEIDTIFDACTSGSTRYSYEGSNGLLVLSRYPIANKSHIALNSSLVQRSVLGAQVDLPKLGRVDFFCTHLAADLSGSITYNGDFDSFAGEQTHQAEATLAFIAANSRAGAVSVLAGDMNSGPAAGASVVAEIPEAAHATFTNAGWTSLNLATPTPQCTYCEDNALNGGGDPVGRLIDHVYVRGLSSKFPTSVSLIGTARIAIDDGGTPVETHPSDHYGASVRFDYRP